MSSKEVQHVEMEQHQEWEEVAWGPRDEVVVVLFDLVFSYQLDYYYRSTILKPKNDPQRLMTHI